MSNPEQETGLITRVADAIRENPIATLAVTAGVALGAAGFKSPDVGAQTDSAGSSQTDKEYTSDVWPAIDQVIDGKEFSGNIQAEQNFADMCKNISSDSRLGRLGAVSVRAARTKNGVGVLSYDVKSLMDCNGYGLSTINLSIRTKRGGEKKFHNGEVATIRDHTAQKDKKVLDLAQKCKPGTSLKAQGVARSTYKHLDGSTKKRTVYSKTVQIC